MTTTILAPFATNDNYSSGPDVGTPTKVDPASPSNGFVAGTAIAPQHVNYLLWALVGDARQALRNGSIPRLMTTLSSTNGVARAFASIGVGLVFVDSGQAAQLYDNGFTLVGAAPTGIIQCVSAAGASNGTHAGRIVVAGDVASGAKYASYTDDQSATWTQSSNFSGSSARIGHLVYEPVHSLWLAVRPGEVHHSADGGAWTEVAVTGAGVHNGSRLVSFENGNVLTDTDSGSRSMVFSSNGGANWNTAQVPANLATANYGVLGGNGGARIYHACLLTGGSYQISSTTAPAVAWSVLSTIAPPSFSSFDDAANGPGLAVCPDTGWVFLLGTNETKSLGFLYASPDGVIWTDPVIIPNPVSENLFAYRGRVVHVDSTGAVFAADGVS